MNGFEIGPLQGTSVLMSTLHSMPAAVASWAVPGLNRGGRLVVAYIRGEELSGQFLQARSGNLRRSVFQSVLRETHDAVLTVGVDLVKAPQGRAHEYGAVIRPRQARRLTIPIGAALTVKGVTRFTAKEVIAAPAAFGFVGTFFRKHVLFGVKRGQPLVPLFVLVEQVRLKPVGYVQRGLETQYNRIQECVAESVASGLRAAKLSKLITGGTNGD